MIAKASKSAPVYRAYFRNSSRDEQCDVYIVFEVTADGVRKELGREGDEGDKRLAELEDFISSGGVFVSPGRCYLELEEQ